MAFKLEIGTFQDIKNLIISVRPPLDVSRHTLSYESLGECRINEPVHNTHLNQKFTSRSYHVCLVCFVFLRC